MKHVVGEQLRLKTSCHKLMLLMRIEKWICHQEPPWVQLAEVGDYLFKIHCDRTVYGHESE